MRTGTKRNNLNSDLLKFAVFACLLMVGARAVQFLLQHIPPYREGSCITIGSQYQLKIQENHIIDGYSDLGDELVKFKASFQDLRESPTIKQAKCDL